MGYRSPFELEEETIEKIICVLKRIMLNIIIVTLLLLEHFYLKNEKENCQVKRMSQAI